MRQSSEHGHPAVSERASGGPARLRRQPASDPPHWIDYAEFGERFVAQAVTPARIEAAVSGMAGQGIALGPFSIGPAGLAGFVAEGSVGKPHIVRSGPHVTFEVSLPVTLHLTVTLGGQRLRLEAVVEIDLTLHARTADPLLIVIDIPPLRTRDVSFVLRAQAIGSAIELLLDPIATLVQREVANRVNAMLADRAAVRARVFDVEAILNRERSPHRSRDRFEWIGYDEFGHRFFPRIVTVDRVREVAETLAGRDIVVGPIRTGPRRMARVDVRGVVGTPILAERPAPGEPEPSADTSRAADHAEAAGRAAEVMATSDAMSITEVQEPAAPDPVTFDLVVPVTLDITVAVLGVHHYRADVEVPLVLVARAADPLLIVIDVAPPHARDVVVRLQPDRWRAKALGSLGSIQHQIAAQVARFVRKELADPSIRTINVGERITAAMS
ncbi:hypothetical protein ABIA39_005086 [Nocardia sp. GAS34]|uniref:hypothetical protein n=1 Tax=unclassified Nocardia TaxID=2637762 RepID=UPI003D1E7AF8